MDLSIIIVNWNSADYVRKCLLSIYSQTKGLDFEVIVIDNASHDRCEGIIRNEFPQTKFIQSKENIGFARANNLGAQHSSGRNLLFLNPDTEIIGSAVNVMFSYLESMPDAGAVGCKLLNSDLSIQTSCIQPFPTILNQILDVEYLKLRFPKFKFWGIKPLFFSNSKPEKVDVISGACIMVKRGIFEKVGLFSTDYFMYSEDVDLCYKIQNAGHKIYYINEAEVVHHGGGSTRAKREDYFAAVLMRESIFRFIKKTRGRTNALIYKLTMLTVSLGRLMLIAALMPLAVLAGKYDALAFPFNKWKKVLSWSMGFERWARESTCNRGDF
jgi:hypothetical protein